MLDRLLRERAQAWIVQDPDPETRAALEEWLSQEDAAALREAFEPSLQFGTAGIRAAVGPGASRMNRANVRRCVAALCDYLHTLNADAGQLGLCVGFDGRKHSERFARDAMAVAVARGFVVRLFEQPVPTPLLAHATRRHGAAAGVMVTASHNPPHDNGLKIYWQGGSQIVPPHDAAIAAALRALDEAPAVDDEQALAHASLLGDDDVERYLSDLCAALPGAPSHALAPRVTYSALGGVGAPLTRLLLAQLGVNEVHEVPGECEIDPELAGLASPNPELPAALTRSLAECERTRSDLMLVHDPDADRLAVGVWEQGRVVVLSGDDVGCLLGDFCLERTPWPRPAVVTTLVSSAMLERVAAAHGGLCRRVPTGFKWITAEGRALEATERARYVFGYEEAIGYGLPDVGDDKDGLAALGLVVRLWQTAQAQGQTLLEWLHSLYADHGVHRSRQLTWTWPDPAHRAGVLERLRNAPPASLAGRDRTSVEQDARAPNLLMWHFEDDVRIALRPSGTEPKLKAYLEARVPVTNAAQVQKAVAEADHVLTQVADALRDLVDAL